MASEHFLFINYLRDSGYVNEGLVKIRREDGVVFYYDHAWRPVQSPDHETVLRWLGTVPTYADLPTNNHRGDVWTVLDENSAEYAWDGTKWEFLGRAVPTYDIGWKNDRNYSIGDIVSFDFNIYFSLVDGNHGIQPGTDSGVSWEKYYPPVASENKEGLIRVATNENIDNGSGGIAAVTPAQLKVRLDNKANLVNGKVPTSELPSYVSGIINGYYINKEFYSDQAGTQLLPHLEDKIYVDLSTNKQYRWGGASYIVIGDSLALGETATTAYPGDKGKLNADSINTLSNNVTAQNVKIQALNEALPKKADLVNGKVNPLQLPQNLTLQGNTFNGADQLVQLDKNAKLPAIDGSQLTGIKSGGLPISIVKTASPLDKNYSYVITAAGNYPLPTNPVLNDRIEIFAQVAGVILDGGTINIADDPQRLINVPNSAIDLVFDGTKWVLSGLTIGRTIDTTIPESPIPFLDLANQSSQLFSGVWYRATRGGIACVLSAVEGWIEVSADHQNILYSQDGKRVTLPIDVGLYYRFVNYANTDKMHFIPYL